jgi:hypothetical protein
MKKVSNSVYFGKANGHRYVNNKLKELNFSCETILGMLSSALNKRKNT